MELDNSTIVLILYCVLAFVLAFYPAYLIFPRFIRKMKALGNTGKDVNKRGNIQVAESGGEQSSPRRRGLGKTGQVLSAGGIVAVFSFSLAMFVIQEEATASRRWKRSVSDWMISPTTVGDYSSPVWLR
jgi:hypothetical protein